MEEGSAGQLNQTSRKSVAPVASGNAEPVASNNAPPEAIASGAAEEVQAVGSRRSRRSVDPEAIRASANPGEVRGSRGVSAAIEPVMSGTVRASAAAENREPEGDENGPKKKRDTQLPFITRFDRKTVLDRGIQHFPDKALVMTAQELDRLRCNSYVETCEEKDAKRIACELEKQRSLDSYLTRKNHFQALDAIRRGNEKLSDLEVENCKKTYEIIEKCNEGRLDQIDEIKRINLSINACKAQAIRERQIDERGHIDQELKYTDQHYFQQMEEKRIQSIVKEDMKQKVRREINLKQRDYLLNQIDEHDKMKGKGGVTKLQEAADLIALRDRLKSEDVERRAREKLKKQDLFLGLTSQIEENYQRKQDIVNQQKVDDLRRWEYQSQADERVQLQDRQRKQDIKERDKAAQHVLMLQQQNIAENAVREDKLLQRQLDNSERMWRCRELNESEKKFEKEMCVKKVLDEQVDYKDHLFAIQARRERQFHMEMVERVRREMEEERGMLMGKRRHNLIHGTDVKNQMYDDEARKIEARKNEIKAGLCLDQELSLEEERRNEHIKKKLNDLKCMKMPEKFVKYIENKTALS